MANGIMSLFFGKKKSRRSSKKSAKSSSGKVVKKRIGYCIKSRRVVNVYKFKGMSGKRLSNKHRLTKGKRIYTTKAAAKSALKKKKAKKSKKTRKHRKSAFGTGGSYMPLESFMAPYPYSVSSSPPWI